MRTPKNTPERISEDNTPERIMARMARVIELFGNLDVIRVASSDLRALLAIAAAARDGQ